MFQNNKKTQKQYKTNKYSKKKLIKYKKNQK